MQHKYVMVANKPRCLGRRVHSPPLDPPVICDVLNIPLQTWQRLEMSEGAQSFKNQIAVRFNVINSSSSSSESDEDKIREQRISGANRGHRRAVVLKRPPHTRRSRLVRAWRRFLQAFDYCFGPWSKNHLCQHIFRSSRSIRREKRRQKSTNRFIIHPFSRFR